MQDSDGSDSGFLGGLTILVVVEFGEIGIEVVVAGGVGVPLAVLRGDVGGVGGGSGGGSLRRRRRRRRHPHLHLYFVEDPD